MVRCIYTACLTSSLFIASTAAASTTQEYDACLLNAAKNQSGNLTLNDIRLHCTNNISAVATPEEALPTLVSQRLQNERKTAFNRFVITPHRMNYFLPIVMTDSINDAAYKDSPWAGKMKNAEAEFQISFKTPLNYGDLLIDDDGLFVAFTLESYWQVYAADLSRPFRETNYRPEIFYLAPTPWAPFGTKTWMTLGIEHQSNGRTQGLSRSWNRVYTDLIIEKGNLALSLRPWWRIPEDKKQTPSSATGDDNPDIIDYMGHYEMNAVYKWQDYEFSFTGRQNFATHKGYGELGLTFPLWGKLRGYTKYSTGYGENLIDYNHKQQRLGIGIALTDLL
ncbi:MAG: phospholipase A [Photobacterium aquimaris]|uniref:Phospholipase A1 n=1 Tax=Photobacterium aquimaris TaxID=512643 RepID=A0A2T3HUQ7_9GAMM|nr:phospholipase A [Photobacterium aquimaris]PSU01101.1 phospholipase [Photobacterium aquimaris]